MKSGFVEGEENELVALRKMNASLQIDEEARRSAHQIEAEYIKSETKKRHRRIKKEVKEKNSQCIEWIKEDEGWEPVEYSGDKRVQIFEKTLENGVYLVKSRGPVCKWDAGTFAYKNMDTNHLSRVRWDTDIAEIRNVETIMKAEVADQVPQEIGLDNMPGKIDVIWYKVAVHPVASALGIWPRDFCCWQYWDLKKDSSILITSSSTFHEKKAVAEEGCVRGETTCAMYIKPIQPGEGELDPKEPTIYVTMVAYVKPNGMIPAKVISWYKHRMGERIEFFSQIYEKATLY